MRTTPSIAGVNCVFHGRRLRQGRRRGATVVELALVSPVVFLLFFGEIVGGLGVFRYQEVAHLARSGARYAATHGGTYQREGISQQTGVPAVASAADLRNFIITKAVLLKPGGIGVAVSWTAAGYTPANMPTYADTSTTTVPPSQIVIQNKVRVTVTYQWFPETYFIGPITLTSTSEMPMSY